MSMYAASLLLIYPFKDGIHTDILLRLTKKETSFHMETLSLQETFQESLRRVDD